MNNEFKHTTDSKSSCNVSIHASETILLLLMETNTTTLTNVLELYVLAYVEAIIHNIITLTRITCAIFHS